VNILWLSWKDRDHPLAGGAETVSSHLMDRLVRDGHSVKLITARYKDSMPRETKGGIEIIRNGGRYSVYAKARSLFKKELRDWPDLVIDEMNTIPFGAGFYSHKKTMLLCYQLAREVWFYQMPHPFSFVGFALEPLMLRAMKNKSSVIATESDSTLKDLRRYGFKNIHTFRVGMELTPVNPLPQKERSNIVLSLGSIRPMKRTLDAVKAFEVAKDKNPDLQMVLAGDNSGEYAENVLKYISQSRHRDSIDVRGRIPTSEKLTLMRTADVIVVTSIKEGWGLIVTEANSQGTPAIGYDADGLRDSIRNNKTGLLCPEGDFTAMGERIVDLLADDTTYQSLRRAAWQWSKEFTFDNSYHDFLAIIKDEK
jgi:glycosyltransferase involved in cell wall biosynthesis